MMPRSPPPGGGPMHSGHSFLNFHQPPNHPTDYTSRLNAPYGTIPATQQSGIPALTEAENTAQHMDPQWPLGSDVYIKPRTRGMPQPMPMSMPMQTQMHQRGYVHDPTMVRNVSIGSMGSGSESETPLSSRMAGFSRYSDGVIMPSHVAGQTSAGGMAQGGGAGGGQGMYAGQGHYGGGGMHSGMISPGFPRRGINSMSYITGFPAPNPSPLPLPPRGTYTNHTSFHTHRPHPAYDPQTYPQGQPTLDPSLLPMPVPIPDPRNPLQRDPRHEVTTDAPAVVIPVPIPRYGMLDEDEMQVAAREMGEMAEAIGGGKPWIYGEKQYKVRAFRPELAAFTNKLNPMGRGFPYGAYKTLL